MDAREQGFVDVAISEQGLGTITFGHPLSNSLPGKILRKLAQTITDLGEDSHVKVILIQSQGCLLYTSDAADD